MELITGGYVFPHFQVMSNELSTPKILMCPQEPDSWRVLASTFCSQIPPGATVTVPFTNDNNVSYFVGVDAVDTNPNAIMTGDHWLDLNGRTARRGLVSLTSKSRVRWVKSPPGHGDAGNIGLADGSVQQFSSTALQGLFTSSGTNLTRLALP